MDRTMKLFFFFCFVVFFFSGCGKNNRNEAVNGPDSKDAGKNAAQMKMEAQNKELQEFQKLLSSSDNLFTQTWQIISQKKDNPKNVFRIVNALLSEYQKLEKEKATPAIKKNEKANSTAPAEERIYTPVLKVEEKKVDERKLAERKLTDKTIKDKTIKVYSIGYKETGSGSGNEEPIFVAKFSKELEGFWSVTFASANLAAGEFAGLGRQGILLEKSDVVECKAIMPSKQGVLRILDCYNLAQDMDEHKDLLLTRFVLNRSLKNDKCNQAFQVAGFIVNNSEADENKRKSPLLMKDFCKPDGTSAIDLSVFEKEEQEAAAQGATKSEPGVAEPVTGEVPLPTAPNDFNSTGGTAGNAGSSSGNTDGSNTSQPDPNKEGQPEGDANETNPGGSASGSGGSDSQGQGDESQTLEEYGDIPPPMK